MASNDPRCCTQILMWPHMTALNIHVDSGKMGNLPPVAWMRPTYASIVNYVFAPSLSGPHGAEKALLAFVEASSNKNPPAPPNIMLTIAAMLRQPGLDAVRSVHLEKGDTAAFVTPRTNITCFTGRILNKDKAGFLRQLYLDQFTLDPNSLQQTGERSLVDWLCYLREPQAIRELLASPITLPYQFDQLNVYNLIYARQAIDLWRRQYYAIIAGCPSNDNNSVYFGDVVLAIEEATHARLFPFHLISPWQMCDNPLEDYEDLLDSPRLVSALRRLNVGIPHYEDQHQQIQDLKAHLAERRDKMRALQAGLPLADVSVLFRTFMSTGDFSLIVPQLRCLANQFTPAQITQAFECVGHGDVGFLSSLLVFDTNFDAVNSHRVLQRLERQRLLQRIYSCEGNPALTLSPWHPDGESRLRHLGTDPTAHVLLSKLTTKVTPGDPAVASRSQFLARWEEFTQGFFEGWDWTGCIVSGGAVVRCLQPGDELSKDDIDIDVFFFGTNLAQTRRRIVELERHVQRKAGQSRFLSLLTSRTLTFVMNYPEGMPRIQVALGVWPAIADVLTTVDVDCCGVAFDGTTVHCSVRAAQAWATKLNVASAWSNALRGSINYEVRLFKYAVRHGFAVLDPLHMKNSGEVSINEAYLNYRYGALTKRAAQRQISVNESGLLWLMAVNQSLIAPTVPRDPLELSAERTLEDLLQAVSEEGYICSDNYGQHEEGYLLFNDGTQGGDEDLDAYEWVDYESNVVYDRQNIAALPLTNVDAARPSFRRFVATWQLSVERTFEEPDREDEGD